MKFVRPSVVGSLLAAFAACTAGTVENGGEPAGGHGGSDAAGSAGRATAGHAGGLGGTTGGATAGSGGGSGGALGGNGSPDGGSKDAAAPDALVSSDAGGDPPPGWIPAIVGVGYAGVRIRSTNEGKSWDHETRLAPTGGDDENLLRSVAYGNGRWGTGGWKYLTSEDGITWTMRAHPCGGGILEGLAFGNGRFVGTCGEMSVWSTDGLKWSQGGRFRAGGHPKVVYGGGKFAAFGDAGQVFSSTDGVTWTSWPGMSDAASCDDMIASRASCRVPGNGAQGRGVWLRGFTPDLGGGGIFRSTDGVSYMRASQTTVEAFAFGWAPPP
jgi:hypothetical protein